MDPNASAYLLIFLQSPYEEQVQFLRYYMMHGYKDQSQTLTQSLETLSQTRQFRFRPPRPDTPYTLFVPIDASYTDLSEEATRYHIVEGTYPRHFLQRLQHHQLYMSNGEPLTILGSEKGCVLQDKRGTTVGLLGDEYFTKNGIIHLIERPLSLN